MNGLLIKEFLALKTNAKVYLTMAVFFIISGALTKNVSYISMMIGTLTLGQSMTNIAYDENSSWDQFALAMPIDRRMVIKSKYIFSFSLLILSFIFAMVISYLTIYIRAEIDLIRVFLSNYAVLYLIGVIFSLMLPITFKFGSEKARVSIFGVILFILLLIYLMNKLLPGSQFLNFIANNYKLGLLGSILTLLIIIGISYFISLKIYKSKDL